MAAVQPSQNSEFVLQAEDIHVDQIQKIDGPPIRGDTLLRNFETHFREIVVSLRAIGGSAIIELWRPESCAAIASRNPL